MGWTSTLHAQSTDYDLATIDGTLTALYASISFEEHEAPNWALFDSLYLDDAQLVVTTEDGYRRLTPADYKQNMNEMLNSGRLLSFKEVEIHRTSDQFGRIAQVFSTYESQLITADGPTTERGINSIQLLKQNGRWRVISLIWDSAGGEIEIPDRYFPKN